MMRKIDLIVIHCSATRADRSLTPDMSSWEGSACYPRSG